MMTSDFIIDVSEADFEYEVLAYSQNLPVVVDFWAEWCRPCRDLSPLLEKIAREAGGAFRLARVDVDHNPNLALRFGVRSLPTVKVFNSGEVVAEFVGLQPEQRLREFFRRLQPPSPAELTIEQGNALLEQQNWREAELLFREALTLAPDHPEGLLGLSKALLAQGKGHEAHSILTSFPASRQYSQAELLVHFASELTCLPDHLPGEEDDVREAAYWNAVRLAGRGKILAALDGLLDLLRQDKNDQRTRKMILSLLEILGADNPLSREYRKEMTSILF